MEAIATAGAGRLAGSPGGPGGSWERPRVRVGRRFMRVGLLGCLMVSLMGCSSGETRLPTVAVRGQVLRGNQPVAHATIVFHPVDASLALAVKPRGQTDAEGRFQLTTYDTADGAPVGDYQVTIEQWATVQADQGPVNRLSAKFATPDRSGLTASVPAAGGDLPPFVLPR